MLTNYYKSIFSRASAFSLASYIFAYKFDHIYIISRKIKSYKRVKIGHSDGPG